MRGIDAKENWDARTKHESERERLSKNEYVLHVWILTAIGLYSLYTDII